MLMPKIRDLCGDVKTVTMVWLNCWWNGGMSMLKKKIRHLGGQYVITIMVYSNCCDPFRGLKNSVKCIQKGFLRLSMKKYCFFLK
jgi:hypothetical protein